MRILYYIFLLAVVIVGTIFAALNLQVVSVNYYLGERSMPLALLVALSFFAGCLIGFMMGLWLLLKSKIKQFRQKRQKSSN